MADISALADATLKLKPTLASHIGMPLAAKMTVRKSGISTNKFVIDRVTNEVLAELKRRSKAKVSSEANRRHQALRQVTPND